MKPVTHNSLIRMDDVHKSFKAGDDLIDVIKGVSFDVRVGDFVVVIGPSGSGKSTLLHMLLGLEVPNSGSVHYSDDDIYAGTTEDDRSDLRKKNIGIVYQQANWIKSMNVGENIAFPLMLLGHDRELAHQRAEELISQVGDVGWLAKMPSELSGGQQQRAALARALVHSPMVLVADEPTGNLDFESGQMVMNLIAQLNKDKNITVIMVTHDLEYLAYANKVVQIFDGLVVGVHEGENLARMAGEVQLKKVPGIGLSPHLPKQANVNRHSRPVSSASKPVGPDIIPESPPQLKQKTTPVNEWHHQLTPKKLVKHLKKQSTAAGK